MKKLFILIMLAGAFLWGYQLGRKPNSPDIIGWGQDMYTKASDTGSKLISAAHGDPNSLVRSVLAGQFSVNANGRTAGLPVPNVPAENTQR